MENKNGNKAFEIKSGIREYINGKINGKVKEYYDNGELEFEGEFINGERNGKGKEYYINGELKFEGEYPVSFEKRFLYKV